jgi:hypothetical protein
LIAVNNHHAGTPTSLLLLLLLHELLLCSWQPHPAISTVPNGHLLPVNMPLQQRYARVKAPGPIPTHCLLLLLELHVHLQRLLLLLLLLQDLLLPELQDTLLQV